MAEQEWEKKPDETLGGEGEPEVKEPETDEELAEAKRQHLLADERAAKDLAEEKSRFAKANIDKVETLTLLLADNEAKATQLGIDRIELASREQVVKEGEQANDFAEKGIAERERKVGLAEEERKRMLISAQEKIAQVDEAHKKARETEDERHRNIYAKRLSTMDELLWRVYNAPNEDISNRVREGIIEKLEPLAEAFGLKPEFNKQNQYIPLSNYIGKENPTVLPGIEVKEEGREKPIVPADNELPTNYRKWLQWNIALWNGLNRKREQHAFDFCRMAQRPLSELQNLMKADDISSSEQTIRELFRQVNRAIMALAGAYQDDQKNDWGNYPDYLNASMVQMESDLSIALFNDDELKAMKGGK